MELPEGLSAEALAALSELSSHTCQLPQAVNAGMEGDERLLSAQFHDEEEEVNLNEKASVGGPPAPAKAMGDVELDDFEDELD